MSRQNCLIGFVALLASLVLFGCGNDQPASTQITSTQAVNTAPRIPTLQEDQQQRQQQEHQRYMQKVKADADTLIPVYQVSAELNELPDPGTLDGLRWQEIAALDLKHLVGEPKLYDEKWYLEGHSFKSFEETDNARSIIRRERTQLLAAYGLLQMGNNPIGGLSVKKGFSEIFSQAATRDTAYRLLLPSVKVAMKQLSKTDHSQYMDILRHTRQYMDSFDLAKEDAYRQRLRSSNKCHEERDDYYKLFGNRGCETKFTSFDADGKENPYRKAEAFVYRRTKDGWSMGDMKNMLDRLLIDL